MPVPGVADVGRSAGDEDLLGVTGVEEASASGDDPDGRGERDRVEPVGSLLGGRPQASACHHRRARSGPFPVIAVEGNVTVVLLHPPVTLHDTIRI